MSIIFCEFTKLCTFQKCSRILKIVHDFKNCSRVQNMLWIWDSFKILKFVQGHKKVHEFQEKIKYFKIFAYLKMVQNLKKSS